MKTQQVLGDTPSDLVYLLTAQVNALNTIVDALFAAIAASTDASGIKTGAAAIDVSAQLQLSVQPGGPAPRQFKAV